MPDTLRGVLFLRLMGLRGFLDGDLELAKRSLNCSHCHHDNQHSVNEIPQSSNTCEGGAEVKVSALEIAPHIVTDNPILASHALILLSHIGLLGSPSM